MSVRRYNFNGRDASVNTMDVTSTTIVYHNHAYYVLMQNYFICVNTASIGGNTANIAFMVNAMTIVLELVCINIGNGKTCILSQ